MPNISAKEFLRNSTPPPRHSSEYIPFWLEHIERCKSGVTVGGVDISGWLYWHTNFFRITVDEEDDYGNINPVIKNLDLRDNEWLFDYALQQAYSSEKRDPLMAFGTRRFAKSTVLASRVAYRTFIQQNAHAVIVGASASDINNITKYLEEYISYRQDCFSDLMRFGQWTKTSSDIQIAYNEREVIKNYGTINPITEHLFQMDDTARREKKLIFSRIAVRNLEHGQVKTKEELLAGLTPTEVIFDECGKYLFGAQWLALKPALATKFGKYRTVAIFVGTGGNTELAQDARHYFLKPDQVGFQVIDMEQFKTGIKSQYFTWKQISDTKTGLFVPSEMSLEGGQKIILPLAEYLDRDFTAEQLEELDGLNIEVTDWEHAKQNVEKEINSVEKKSQRDKMRMYYPDQPEDCFKNIGKNPFPVEVAVKTQKALFETGLDGEHVELHQDKLTGSIIFEPSDKEPVKEYPFQGGAHDSPWLVFEKPLDNIQPNMYVAGFDGYKIDVSETTDSLGSIGIFKRKIGVTGYQHQLVATLTTRPVKDTMFYHQAMLGLMAYNATCLPERDTNFYKYLENHNMTHLLADCSNLVQGITPNSRANTTHGLPPTAQNQQHLLKLVINYCWEEIVLGYDPEGNPIMGLGIERISDPWLLEEIIMFGTNDNYDRIIMFGHALAWDYELRVNNIFPEYSETPRREVDVDSLLNKVRARRHARPF